MDDPPQARDCASGQACPRRGRRGMPALPGKAPHALLVRGEALPANCQFPAFTSVHTRVRVRWIFLGSTASVYIRATASDVG